MPNRPATEPLTQPTQSTAVARPAADRTAGPALHRSGAVARMLRMPVATLRVWERRYTLTRPQLSPSGQRLYSADDVRRLALMKQLTDLGHAIGSLAALDMPGLQQVAATHAQVLAASHGPVPAAAANAAEPLPPAAPRRWRLAVVGTALAARLQRPALLRRLGPAVELLGPYEDLAQAGTVLQRDAADALLLHAPQLQAGWLAAIKTAAPTLAALPRAVLYGFAAGPVCEALADAGTALLREPQPDTVLAQWLRSMAAAATATATATATVPGTATPGATRAPDTNTAAARTGGPGSHAVPPRRWDDSALADFAGLSSTIACECPRHVAELLVQLSQFEAYSAQCENRGPADAELHAYLRRVTAASRASFETALEHVARLEGLTLPPRLPHPAA